MLGLKLKVIGALIYTIKSTTIKEQIQEDQYVIENIGMIGHAILNKCNSYSPGRVKKGYKVSGSQIKNHYFNKTYNLTRGETTMFLFISTFQCII
jgi:hypothetical protein